MAKIFPLFIIGILAIVTGGIFLLHRQNAAFDYVALLAGNTLMAVLTLIAFAIARRNIAHRPQAFVRGVFSAMMLKMFVCIAAIIAYAFLHKEKLHKPTLLLFFLFYAVYTAIETLLLQRMAREAR